MGCSSSHGAAQQVEQPAPAASPEQQPVGAAAASAQPEQQSKDAQPARQQATVVPDGAPAELVEPQRREPASLPPATPPQFGTSPPLAPAKQAEAVPPLRLNSKGDAGNRSSSASPSPKEPPVPGLKLGGISGGGQPASARPLASPRAPMLASPRGSGSRQATPRGNTTPKGGEQQLTPRRGPPPKMPMWACPISEELRLGRLTMHEELKPRDLLTDYLSLKAEERKGVIFFSQVWLGSNHPDPNDVKYGVMADFLRRAQAGQLDFQMDFEEELTSGRSGLPAKQVQEMLQDGFVWLDYQSVPQRNLEAQQQHIECLSLYVRHCTFFAALVPPATHEDTGELVDIRTWSRNGWCRAELLCNVLSDDPAPFLKIESSTCRRISTARDFVLHPIGAGVFKNNSSHVGREGRAMEGPSDRERLSNMINRLVGLKIHTMRKLDSRFTMRLLLSLQAHLLSDLEIDTTEDSDIETWLSCLGFTSATEQVPSGWTPLRCAVYANRLDLAVDMIRAKADVESPLAQDCTRAAYFHGRGMTILQGVALLQDNPEAIRMLINCKAEVDRTWEGGFTALFAAAVGGRAQNVATLLDAKADPMIRDSTGGNLLHIACAHGSAEVIQVLQQKCPQLQDRLAESEGVGLGYLSAGIMLDRGDVQALRMAIELKAEVNHVTLPQAPWLGTLVQKAQAACFVSPYPTPLDAWAANAPGMTPLLWASFFGNVPAVRLLLEHRADTTAVNEYGRSAVCLAAMAGHRAVCQALLDAGAPVKIQDSWGRDAAAWARHKGDMSLEKALQVGAAASEEEEVHVRPVRPPPFIDQLACTACRCEGGGNFEFVEAERPIVGGTLAGAGESVECVKQGTPKKAGLRPVTPPTT